MRNPFFFSASFIYCFPALLTFWAFASTAKPPRLPDTDTSPPDYGMKGALAQGTSSNIGLPDETRGKICNGLLSKHWLPDYTDSLLPELAINPLRKEPESFQLRYGGKIVRAGEKIDSSLKDGNYVYLIDNHGRAAYMPIVADLDIDLHFVKTQEALYEGDPGPLFASYYPLLYKPSPDVAYVGNHRALKAKLDEDSAGEPYRIVNAGSWSLVNGAETGHQVSLFSNGSGLYSINNGAAALDGGIEFWSQAGLNIVPGRTKPRNFERENERVLANPDLTGTADGIHMKAERDAELTIRFHKTAVFQRMMRVMAELYKKFPGQGPPGYTNGTLLYDALDADLNRGVITQSELSLITNAINEMEEDGLPALFLKTHGDFTKVNRVLDILEDLVVPETKDSPN